jgi:hypothetical protein
VINKHERDKSLDFLDNFVNSYNNLSDADIDSLFETYKNDKADGFEACVNNEYDFIINNLNETVDLFLKSHCNVRLSNFKNIEEASDSFSNNSVYNIIKDLVFLHPNSLNKRSVQKELKAAQKESILNNEKELFKGEFINDFISSMEKASDRVPWRSIGLKTRVIDYYNIPLLKELKSFIYSIEFMDSLEITYSIYYSPKSMKFSFNYGELFDATEIGRFHIGFKNGKISTFQKNWKEKNLDLKEILKKMIKSFLKRRYGYIIKTINENHLTWDHIKGQKIPLCLISEEKLVSIKNRLLFIPVSDVLALAEENSFDEFEKILNFLKEIAKEKLESSSQYKKNS